MQVSNRAKWSSWGLLWVRDLTPRKSGSKPEIPAVPLPSAEENASLLISKFDPDEVDRLNRSLEVRRERSRSKRKEKAHVFFCILKRWVQYFTGKRGDEMRTTYSVKEFLLTFER